LETDKNMTNLW